MTPVPNGFFINGMLWYDLPRGDALMVKGYRIDLQDVSGADVETLNDFQKLLSNLLFGLPDNVHIQSQWRVTSDYREALRAYGESSDTAENEWTLFVREELRERLKAQMKAGLLRKEEHILWFTAHLDSPLSKIVSSARKVEKNLDILIQRQGTQFENLARSLQQSFGSFATVETLDDIDNFVNYRNLLNPSLLNQSPEAASAEFDPEATIQELVFRSDGVEIDNENASFHFAGHYHSLFVISRWPSTVRPLDVMTITNLPFNDYVITTNLYPKNKREEIAKEEKMIERLEGEILSERKRSLVSAKEKKERKVDELARGFTRLFSTLQVIRVWDKSVDGLAGKCEAMKAAISDMGAQYYHVTNATTARNVFLQTWPGATHSKYRGYDIEGSNAALACLLPFSSTFTGILDEAEALFHGATRNVVGFRTFAGATPQHMLVLGGTGAGKSVTMNAILSQTENIYDRTIIIEEGFSYATYVQTLGIKPIILQLDGELTLNYLDTNGLPLSSHHIGTAAALCLKMVGFSNNEDVNRHRLAILGEYINAIYEDAAHDWFMAYPSRVEELQRLGYAVDHFRIHHQPHGTTFTEAYLAFRERQTEEPEETTEYLDSFSSDEILKWSKERDGARIARDLVFTTFEHGDYANLTHHTLYMQLRFGSMPHHSQEEIHYLADMLGTWTREIGQRGKFFDGISNIALDEKVLLFELSLIPEAAGDFKEAAGFLINNVVRHLVMTDPRSWKKRIIFEEAPRFFNVPGGDEIISTAYATYRKYGAWLVTIAQQLSQIPASLRTVLVGNSAIKMVFRQKSESDLRLLRDELRLPAVTVDSIANYPSPETLPKGNRYSSFCYLTEHRNKAVSGTVRVYASPEMLYLSSTDGDVAEERAKALLSYENILDGIQAEISNATEEAQTTRKLKNQKRPLMTVQSLILPFAMALTMISCSTTGARKTGIYGAGGLAGGAIGNALSDDDPLWTAAGTAAGIGGAALVNNAADKEVAAATAEGYAHGQGDATRQHYWMLQSLQQNANGSYGVRNTYDVTIPANTDEFGVSTVSRQATVRIIE